MSLREFLFHQTLPRVTLLIEARVERNERAEEQSKQEREHPKPRYDTLETFTQVVKG